MLTRSHVTRDNKAVTPSAIRKRRERDRRKAGLQRIEEWVPKAKVDEARRILRAMTAGQRKALRGEG